MKKLWVSSIFIIFSILLTACTNGLSDGDAEGFVFTEDEALGIVDEIGFDFTEDGSSAQNLNPADDTLSDQQDDTEDGMDFSDDEGLDLTQEDAHVVPQEGVSNWIISHNDGTATCSGTQIKIWGNEDEIVTINVGVEAAGLEIKGLDGSNSMFYVQTASGIGGSSYFTEYVPPGASSPIQFEILFTNRAEGTVADFLMGEISGSSDGCEIYRTFQGTLLD